MESLGSRWKIERGNTASIALHFKSMRFFLRAIKRNITDNNEEDAARNTRSLFTSLRLALWQAELIDKISDVPWKK